MLLHRTPRTVALATLAAFAMSCATTRLPPISAAGAGFTPERDEKRLWERSRQEEKKLRENLDVYEDPLLEDYLEDVVGGLNTPGMVANPELSYRVTVVEDPTLNAFAFPTGSLYIHTGLLARMENERQLATVLGHEMTHVENRHMLRHRRSARNKQIAIMTAAVAGAVITASEQGQAARKGQYGKAARIGVLADLMLGLGLQLAFLASVNGYGRDLEREADQGGFAKMAEAGYDPREAESVYQALFENHGDAGKFEAFFFGSHPRLQERIESARTWSSEHPDFTVPASSRTDPSAFERRIRPVIRDDARLNMEMGRLGIAEAQLKRVLDLLPEDPETHYLLGKLKLARAENEKDSGRVEALRAEAMDSFREAIRLDPERPAPHREVGLLAYRNGDHRTACVEFRQYLELDPKAEDAQRIRDYRLELERDGHCP